LTTSQEAIYLEVISEVRFESMCLELQLASLYPDRRKVSFWFNPPVPDDIVRQFAVGLGRRVPAKERRYRLRIKALKSPGTALTIEFADVFTHLLI